MIRGLLFLEDRAQELFVVSLVRRLLAGYGLAFQADVRSSTGGARVWGQLEQFAGDLTRDSQRDAAADMLVVAVDANCKGLATVTDRLAAIVEPTGLLDRSAFCVPDPHIERWYLLDLHALKKTIGAGVHVSVPSHKCDRDYYKDLLGEAVRESGSMLGGSEFGSELAERMSIVQACGADASFKAFVSQVRIRAKAFKLTGA